MSKTQTCIKSSLLKAGKVYVVNNFRVDFTKMTGIFAPYWHIKPAGEHEEANMKKDTLKHGNLHIPILVNTKQVLDGTLLRYEPEVDASASKKRKTQNKP